MAFRNSTRGGRGQQDRGCPPGTHGDALNELREIITRVGIFDI